MQNSEVSCPPRVIAKLKPQVQIEEGACKVSYKQNGNEFAIYDQIDNAVAKVYPLKVDHILGEKSTIADLYNLVRPNVQRVVQGTLASIICYGTTKSGKTYNTFGTSDNEGILQRAVRDLFQGMKDAEAKGGASENKPEGLPKSSITARVFQMYRDSFHCLTPSGPIEMLGSQIQSVSILDKTRELQIEAPTADELITKINSARSKQFKGDSGNKGKSHFAFVFESNVVVYDEGDENNDPSYTVSNGILVVTDLAGLSIVSSIKDKEEKEDARINNISLFHLGKVIDAFGKGQTKASLFHLCPLTRILEVALNTNASLDVVLTLRGYDGDMDNEFYKMMYSKTETERAQTASLITANSANEAKHLEEVPVLNFGALAKGVEFKSERRVTLLTLDQLEEVVRNLRRQRDSMTSELKDLEEELRSVPHDYESISPDLLCCENDLSAMEAACKQAINDNRVAMNRFFKQKEKLAKAKKACKEVKKVREQVSIIDEVLEEEKALDAQLEQIKGATEEGLENKQKCEELKKSIKKTQAKTEEAKKKTLHHKTQLDRWVDATKPADGEGKGKGTPATPAKGTPGGAKPKK